MMPAAADAEAARLTPAPDRARTAAEPLLRLEQVSKWYGSVLALNEVSLELDGGILALVGSNGSGKSTLLRLAAGQLRPTLGRVTVCGLAATDWQSRRRIGYSPDTDRFYEGQTAWAFLCTLGRLCGYDRQEARRRSGRVLEIVGLTAHAHRLVPTFSKGMRQRLKLAQALLHDPELLLLDEPLSGLDPIQRREVLTFLRTWAGDGRGILISSHELEAVEQLTDRIAILAQGRIAACGTVRQIREQLRHWPLRFRLEGENLRGLAAELVRWPQVQAVEIAEASGPAEHAAMVVHVHHAANFLEQLNACVAQTAWPVWRLTPLDASAQAVLDYLLGGSASGSA